MPIVYLDRDARNALKDGYGVTITTVVVKPKSRGEVRLASADPKAMLVVSPNLPKHPDDMATMVAGQRFFLRTMAANPLAQRIKNVAVPNPDDTSDTALIAHCKRFVKSNYHPAGTAKMGADGDPMAVLDARMRVCDMSAVPAINAGNSNALAMMLGDRCADLIMGRIVWRPGKARTLIIWGSVAFGSQDQDSFWVYSQNITVPASATAYRKTFGRLSKRVETLRQSFSRPSMI